VNQDAARCGKCRSGVTYREATYGLQGGKAGPVAGLPVPAEGQDVEGKGLRCSVCNGGVACGNVPAGVGFRMSEDRYKLNSRPAESASAAPGKASKTP
jgi:hypothetical protein